MLTSRREREREGLFVSDGTKLLAEAVRHFPGLDTVILSDGLTVELPETVKADLAYQSAYWKQFKDSAIQKISTNTYDGMLKVYGEPLGIQSYGTAVDMLVAYYK